MQKRRIVLFETGNSPHNPTNSKDIIMTSTALPTMTLQGISATTGAAVSEEVAFKLSSNSLTASCKKVVADAKKHAKSDQKNEEMTFVPLPWFRSRSLQNWRRLKR